MILVYSYITVFKNVYKSDHFIYKKQEESTNAFLLHKYICQIVIKSDL